MNKLIIGLVFVFILLISSAIFLYIVYEKPNQDLINSPATTNITLIFIDEKQIATGYIISLDNSPYVYDSGITTENDYLYLTIPLNHSFSVFNNNTLNQRYYTEIRDFNTNLLNIINNEVKLVPYGNLSIVSNSKISELNGVILNISSIGEVRCLKACVRGSTNIVSIKGNYDKINIPKRLINKVDNCYDLKETINNNYTILNLTYSKFGELRDDDFIKIYIIDGDYRFNDRSCNFEDLQGRDIGIDDFMYEVKY